MWQSYGQMPACVSLLFLLQTPPTPQLSQMLPTPTGSNDQLFTYCPFLPVLSLTSHDTTSLTVNNISSSPISLGWPVWCFRYNKNTENGNSSDKSYYNPMQHNSRGQTALNSRWVLPVPGRKWHWAPSLSYFILAQNRDYHHFIFSTSIPHRVCWKFISVFLFSFSVWIPLGLLSSLARNTGHSNASVLPQSLSSPLLCCLSGWNGDDFITTDLTQMRHNSVCAHVQGNTLIYTYSTKVCY